MRGKGQLEVRWLLFQPPDQLLRRVDTAHYLVSFKEVATMGFEKGSMGRNQST